VTAPLLILRPEPGASATLAAATAAGIDAWCFPLFAVEPVAWDAPRPDEIDALLIGSANAVRHAGSALSQYAGKPAYVVGERTAAAARAAGFTVAATGEGGLAPVLARAPAGSRLLRLAGRERIELAPPPGVTFVERTVYASEPQPLSRECARLLKAHALPRVVVLLHSAEAARHFAAECDRLAISRARIALAALGPRIAAAAGEGWAMIATAQKAEDGALLVLADQLCQ
jgi:uroporphyrinogen-III synthase